MSSLFCLVPVVAVVVVAINTGLEIPETFHWSAGQTHTHIGTHARTHDRTHALTHAHTHKHTHARARARARPQPADQCLQDLYYCNRVYCMCFGL